MCAFVIHLYACFFSYIYMRVCMPFFHTFVCVFLSYICMRFCMRFCHTFVCMQIKICPNFLNAFLMPYVFILFFLLPSAEQTTNAVPTVMTPPQKHLYLHVFFIHSYACFFIHLYAICFACFCHTFVCGFFHTFLCVFVCVFFIHLHAFLYACFFHTFVCVFLSNICMRVYMRDFVIHLYVYK